MQTHPARSRPTTPPPSSNKPLSDFHVCSTLLSQFSSFSFFLLLSSSSLFALFANAITPAIRVCIYRYMYVRVCVSVCVWLLFVFVQQPSNICLCLLYRKTCVYLCVCLCVCVSNKFAKAKRKWLQGGVCGWQYRL